MQWSPLQGASSDEDTTAGGSGISKIRPVFGDLGRLTLRRETMTLRLAISGFGRIGRMTLRAFQEMQRNVMEVVLINSRSC